MGLTVQFELIGIDSPRYYNNRGDELMFNITMSDDDWDKASNILANTGPEFEKWLSDNYSSYDGYTSLTSNTRDNFIENFNQYKQHKATIEQAVGLYYIIKDVIPSCNELTNELYYGLIESHTIYEFLND